MSLCPTDPFCTSGSAYIFELIREVPVEIDIKPDSFPNSIKLGSGGTVPVAIFSAKTFGVTQLRRFDKRFAETYRR